MKVGSLPRSVLAGRERLAARAQQVLRQNDMGVDEDGLGTLPSPVELGQRLHRHRASPPRHTPCRAGAASGVDGGLRRPPLQPRRAKLAPRTPLASDC